MQPAALCLMLAHLCHMALVLARWPQTAWTAALAARIVMYIAQAAAAGTAARPPYVHAHVCSMHMLPAKTNILVEAIPLSMDRRLQPCQERGVGKRQKTIAHIFHV